MRTNIEIDDELMRSAMDATGFKTKKETVEEGLRLLARGKRQRDALRELAKLGPWEGDLDDLRRDSPDAKGEW